MVDFWPEIERTSNILGRWHNKPVWASSSRNRFPAPNSITNFLQLSAPRLQLCAAEFLFTPTTLSRALCLTAVQVWYPQARHQFEQAAWLICRVDSLLHYTKPMYSTYNPYPSPPQNERRKYPNAMLPKNALPIRLIISSSHSLRTIPLIPDRHSAQIVTDEKP